MKTAARPVKSRLTVPTILRTIGRNLRHLQWEGAKMEENCKPRLVLASRDDFAVLLPK